MQKGKIDEFSALKYTEISAHKYTESTQKL